MVFKKIYGRFLAMLFGHVKLIPKDQPDWNLFYVEADDISIEINICKFTGDIFVSKMEKRR